MKNQNPIHALPVGASPAMVARAKLDALMPRGPEKLRAHAPPSSATLPKRSADWGTFPVLLPDQAAKKCVELASRAKGGAR